MTMEELDKEVEELMKKLKNEKVAIDEARLLRENRRDMRDVIAHAKRGDSAAADAAFFITSVDTGDMNEEPKKEKRRQLYPNLEKEHILAREESKRSDRRLSRLKAQSSELSGAANRHRSKTSTAASASTSRRKALREGGIVGGAPRLQPIPGMISEQ